MTLLQIAKDTVYIKFDGSGNFWTQQLTTIIVGLLGAIVGGVITVWYKKKEIELQTTMLKDTIENNQNKLS